ncbi:MAG TPA: alkaline phosphatase family protein [Gemmatimonas sp.]|uniref:alkaline phosphatase family protein n=1 Tax=Gemmatimonas sp. TaxID=1962908 RepID=UPI002ED85FF6
MRVILNQGKLIVRAAMIYGSLLVATGCLPFRRPAPEPVPEELPRRLVLALDGLDFRDVQEARARGQFAAFRAPGRLISTFPSISDIAWHAIFGVQPPPGYQRVYYSTRHNAVLGDALDAIRPIEYEERMDMAFDAKFHHLGAYLMSWPTARREIDADVKGVLRSRGRATVYVYNVGPDALQHMRGNVSQYLTYLDRALTDLNARYRQRTGRDLEIVLLSDHGHNRAVGAKFLPVADVLRASGFRLARTLTTPNDVAFSVDGVTTGFGVFCLPEAESRVMDLLVSTPGVDIVTRRLDGDRFLVAADSARAEVAWRREGTQELYRYDATAGDPLQLHDAMQIMRNTGAMRADGFASAAAWVRATADGPYPAAVVRIVHGHRDATRNPAPILVSLHDDHRVGLGMVSVANRMRPLGGTHGALGASSAVGVVMSNFQDTHDDLAMTVRGQFGGFDDMRVPSTRRASLTLTTAGAIRANRFATQRSSGWGSALADTTTLALLTLTTKDLQWAGDSAQVHFEVWRRNAAGRRDVLIGERSTPLATWDASVCGATFSARADSLYLIGLEPGALHTVRVRLSRRKIRDGQWVVDGSRSVLTLTLRAASDGVLWRY